MDLRIDAARFTRFRVLSFDCYGTLIDWETGILSALRPILDAHGKSLDDAALLELYGELEADAEAEHGQSFQNYHDVLRSVVVGVGERLGFAASENEASSLAASVPNWKPFPDTIEALQKLKTRYRLAVISNIDDALFAASARQLEVEFDYVITAQQSRAYKPSLKIFYLAQQRLGLPPEQWLHVGQSVYHDVIPAKSLGIATVWANRASRRHGIGAVRSASGQPDLEVPDLEVPDLRTLADLAVNKGKATPKA